MDYSREQAGSKLGWVARQPLLFGLVAAGGAGLIAVTQMAGPPEAGDGAGKLPNLPKQNLAEPVPAPDFGPVAAAAAEARIGGAAKPARLANVTLAVRPEAAPASRLIAYPQRISLPAAALPQSLGKRRHTGSFAVPSASEASIAANAGPALPQNSEPAVQAATLVAYQPAPHSLSPQLDRLVEAQMSPRTLVPAEQSASAALVVTQRAEALPQQSAVRSVLPEAQSEALAAPASPVATPVEPSPASPIVRAGSGVQHLVAPQPQAAASALALASPAGKTGIEGLAGLDDSQLSGVRPIIGEPRQQATSAKRRSNAAGVAQPNARAQTAEEAAPNPDKISATGSGIDMHVPAQINGSAMGNLPLHVAADSTISVRLGDLLSLVDGQMDSQLFNDFQTSSAADSQISLATLRAAGMQLRYEPAANQVSLQVSQG